MTSLEERTVTLTSVKSELKPLPWQPSQQGRKINGIAKCSEERLVGCLACNTDKNGGQGELETTLAFGDLRSKGGLGGRMGNST